MLSCIIETLQKPLYFNRKQLHENASVEKIKNKQIMLHRSRLVRTRTAVKQINGEEPPLSCCSDLYSCSLALEDMFHCHVLRS